jgi:hypothetical protein
MKNNDPAAALNVVSSDPSGVVAMFDRAIRESIVAIGALPEELADVLTLRVVTGADGVTRHIVEPA